MAVEWLRCCHSGQWRFYADNPDLITHGVYYFVRPDAPHLPFAHDFGSAVWCDDADELEERFGEVVETSKPWYHGRFPLARPPETPVGTQAEFEGQLNEPLVPVPTVFGVPQTCWTQVGAPLVPVEHLFDFFNCCLQIAYARCLELTYEHKINRLREFFLTWLGPETQVFLQEVAGLYPALSIVKHPSVTLVFVSGTSNFQQLALQGFYGTRPPEDFGAFSTERLWWQCGDMVVNLLATWGVNHDAPIVLVGHSYGGASAATVACRLKLAKPARRVGLMTFGCPKVGDERYLAIQDTYEHLYIANEDDIVTAVPPSLKELRPFVPIFGALIIAWWRDWHSPRMNLLVDADGGKAFVAPRFLDASIVVPVVTNCLAAVNPDPIAAHYVGTYRERLAILCAAHPCFPLSPEAWEIISDPEAEDLPNEPVGEECPVAVEVEFGHAVQVTLLAGQAELWVCFHDIHLGVYTPSAWSDISEPMPFRYVRITTAGTLTDNDIVRANNPNEIPLGVCAVYSTR